MKVDETSIKILGNRLELRIHGWGTTGKGDRWTLLSRNEARKLAYALLGQSEDVQSDGSIAA
jgi:hypothetical protein